MCRHLGDPSGIALALHSLGMVSCQLGEHDQARKELAESVRIRHDLGDHPGLAAGLNALASVALARGQSERATRLLAAATALRQFSGAPRPADDQQHHERMVTQLHETLPVVVFDAASAAGQAMTLDQAITYALEDTPEGIEQTATSA
jgi:hypothetical protein